MITHGKIRTSEGERIAALLAKRVPLYFEDFRGTTPDVYLTRSHARPYSELHEFTVQSSGMTGELFVKVPFLEKSRPPAESDRPRLFPPVVPEQMAALEYTVIGDPVNTGSRLCSLAKPGQTLISEGTHEKLGKAFELRELPPEQLRGKAQPIRVFELLGRAERA